MIDSHLFPQVAEPPSSNSQATRAPTPAICAFQATRATSITSSTTCITATARPWPFWVLLGWLLASPVAWGQDDDEEELEFRPGVIARVDFGSTLTERRIEHEVHLNSKSALLPSGAETAGPTRVSWNGLLQVQPAGQYTFAVFAQGHVQLSVAGEQLLDARSERPEWHTSTPSELRFGKHELSVEYTSDSHTPQLGLFWSGPDFGLEPIPPRMLWHRASETPQTSIALGEKLSRGLRCAACHTFGETSALLPAPALTHMADNLRPSWLERRLTESSASDQQLSAQRMPHFQLHPNSAAAISAALFKASLDSAPPDSLSAKLAEASRRRKKNEEPPRTQPDLASGGVAFASIGCLACHQVDDLGQPATLDEQLFSGGDLSQVSAKRTPAFFQRWLEHPAQVNSQHRMPVFELSMLEELDLIAYLASLGQAESRQDTRPSGDATLGQALIFKHRCGACHQLPPGLDRAVVRTPIDSRSDWDAGCLTAPDPNSAVPGFGLDAAQRHALQQYVTRTSAAAPGPGGDRDTSAADLLAENNCMSCHARNLAPGIARHLPNVATAHPETAARLAGLSPPALNAIGDKLTDEALAQAITRKSPALRPWLDVRMPQFDLQPEEVEAMVDYFIAHDRIPEKEPPAIELPTDRETQLAAARLVTADGFGCQSCHQIGDMDPPTVDLKARGTNLAMLGDRIRHAWFHRWVRDPARIVPKMEMPAIKIAAKGVLGDSIDLQLEAVWQTLNTPDFRPPRPNPVQVVRSQNVPGVTEPSHVLTDVLETPDRVYLRPITVGLPNRHNVLFDLEDGSLAAWWLGDTARQHTRGKTWFWEPGSEFLQPDAEYLERASIIDSSGGIWLPTRQGQTAVQLDSIHRDASGTHWAGRMHFSRNQQSRMVPIQQTIRTAGEAGNDVEIVSRMQLQLGERVLLDTAGKQTPTEAGSLSLLADGGRIEYRGADNCSVEVVQEQALSIAANAEGERSHAPGSVAWTSRFNTDLSPGSFPQADVVWPKLPAKEIECVPGYRAVQLPLPPTEMPISFAWSDDGAFYAGSLKGHVVQLHDDDDDGLHERYTTISDGYPTPYGLSAHDGVLDILAKFALIRLTPSTFDVPMWDATVVADGWGYTADYHDWAVGLERDDDGNYYMALPCQQDDRSEAAAYLRGQALMLVESNDRRDGRLYQIEPLAAGLRFPMGIVRSRQGDLFTTDNQGNYNPFNELNHLRPGKRYGFINKLENKDGFSPPFESPAINLPHPWTRSVNGICFLQTPRKLLADGGPPLFGPLEGHLIGCEMNGQALVRMSLQKVAGTYQGAAYMFSRPVVEGENNFEGPIVCEISPDGALYVGNLQDSGWGGGQNTGSIVRLTPSGALPPGIAEVRATATGFEVDFTQPVEAHKAAEPSNYAIRSYRRVSTPAYGGDDQDEQAEPVRDVTVSSDRMQVVLRLNPLREGCVYELNLQPLTASGVFFPSQAHYTMRAIPE